MRRIRAAVRKVRERIQQIGEQGFSLAETVVTIAVIAIFAAALMPALTNYLEDARTRRAEAEVKVIAAALASLVKDLHKYPAYTGTKNSGAPDIELLCSAGDLPGFADGVTDWPFTAGAACASGGKIDTLENILVRNTPLGSAANAFNTSSRERGQWRGPYGERFNLADPWERSYVVNIKNGAVGVPGDPDVQRRVIWVGSGGPNGVFDTLSDTLITAGDLVPRVDDIMARVK